MTNSYKQIQFTNNTINAVAVDAFMPLGNVTRRINTPVNCCNTFTFSNSAVDTVTINDAGFYKVTYSLTAAAAADGVVTIELVVNDNTVYTVSSYIADATAPVNMTLPYTIRVCPSCSSSATSIPVTLQLKNTGIALTGTSSNLIIEKV